MPGVNGKCSNTMHATPYMKYSLYAFYETDQLLIIRNDF